MQKKLSTEDVNSLLDVIAKLTKRTKQIGGAEIDLVSLMDTARTERITFYEAAYLTGARDRKLSLVSDDNGLLRLALKYIDVQSSSEL